MRQAIQQRLETIRSAAYAVLAALPALKDEHTIKRLKDNMNGVLNEVCVAETFLTKEGK